jgi:hypothetical protein
MRRKWNIWLINLKKGLGGGHGGWRAGESAPNILFLLFDIIQNISFGMKHCRLGCPLQLSTIADNQVWHHAPLCCALKLSTVGGVSLLASCITVLRSQTFHHVSPILEGYQFWHHCAALSNFPPCLTYWRGISSEITYHWAYLSNVLRSRNSRSTALTYQTFLPCLKCWMASVLAVHLQYIRAHH